MGAAVARLETRPDEIECVVGMRRLVRKQPRRKRRHVLLEAPGDARVAGEAAKLGRRVGQEYAVLRLGIDFTDQVLVAVFHRVPGLDDQRSFGEVLVTDAAFGPAVESGQAGPGVAEQGIEQPRHGGEHCVDRVDVAPGFQFPSAHRGLLCQVSRYGSAGCHQVQLFPPPLPQLACNYRQPMPVPAATEAACPRRVAGLP